MDFINVGMGAAAGDHTSLRMRSHPSRSEPEGGALAAWAWAGQGVGSGGHLDFPGKGGVRGKKLYGGGRSEEEGRKRGRRPRRGRAGTACPPGLRKW